MKRYITLLVAGLLVLASGCASNYVVEWKAKPHVEFDQNERQNTQVAGHPAYYALLPLSVPVDIATSPIQLGILLAWPAAKTIPATNHAPVSL
jgi:hypothetical protein